MQPDSVDEESSVGVALEMETSPAEVVAHARQRHGVAGAVLAGAMVGFQQVLDPKPRDLPPVVVEASGEPLDIDRDGISVTTAGVTVHSRIESAPPVPGPRVGVRRPFRRGRAIVVR